MSGAGPDAATRALGACGLLAAALFGLADVAGSVATPGYSMRTQAISELVARGAPAKALVDPLLLAYHALAIPFALGLRGAFGGAGPAFLAGAGAAGVALTLFFPCDPGCAPFTSFRGTAHIFIAVPMGFAILGGIWALGGRMRSQGRTGLARYSRCAALAGILLAAATVALAETQAVGLLERLLTWSYLQWYAALGAWLLVGAAGRD